jgi:hypothetical protein
MSSANGRGGVLRISPQAFHKDKYRCPRCSVPIPIYQLRNDRFGIPRAVDVSGTPCDDCLRVLNLEIDDGK